MIKLGRRKWIAGVLALALAGGLAVTTTACGGADRETERNEGVRKESDKEPEAAWNGGESDENLSEDAGNGREDADDPLENGGDGQQNAVDPSENAAQDYGELAARIEEGAVTYLEALKAGDIKTVLSMTDPESVTYKKLSGIQDYETGKEFVSALFGRAVYKWKEERNTERYVEEIMGGEQAGRDFYLSIYVGMPSTTYLSMFLVLPGVVFQDGELIPEGYKVSSDEEALEMVRSAAALIPLEDTALSVELQEDGEFWFDMVGPFLCLDDTDFGSGENFLPEYLTEQIFDGKIVGKSDGVFEEDNEDYMEILALLRQKDFDGLLALANGNPDKYIKKVFSEQTPYRTPEELTEAQRAFYDSYVEQIEVYIEMTAYPESKGISAAVLIAAPARGWRDREREEWYAENGIKECTVAFRFGDKGLIDAMSTLLRPLKHGIEYAEQYY
ncbi:MAG: hypothetical protein NC517_09075 [Firmicutes bacterium]|nr:hypothetical protein [Bacillota bacterium]